MAFVELGRSQRLEDIYIIPEPEIYVDAIRCDPEALAETKRLEQIFNEMKNKENETNDKCWKVSYLNVRSIKSLDGHRDDVSNDQLLMRSDILGLGETWLEDDHVANFTGFDGYFATFGKGKGVAGYNRMSLVSKPLIVTSNSYSAIQFMTSEFHVIFLYLSHGYKKTSVNDLLNTWIQPNTPTAVLGDMNEDIFRNSSIQNFMASKGFSQLINEPTCSTGSVLDHIYVNDLMSKKGTFSKLETVYFSDHDVISLYVPK